MTKTEIKNVVKALDANADAFDIVKKNTAVWVKGTGRIRVRRAAEHTGGITVITQDGRTVQYLWTEVETARDVVARLTVTRDKVRKAMFKARGAWMKAVKAYGARNTTTAALKVRYEDFGLLLNDTTGLLRFAERDAKRAA